MDRVKQDFVAPRSVPKFFILGRYGAGKTHSLAHIAYELRTSDLASDFPTETIYIEIGPIKSKDQWSTVHRRILDAVGLSRLRNAVNAVITKHGNAGDVLAALRQAEVLRYGEESLRQSQGQIFRNLLFGGMQETMSWEWLKGRALNATEAQILSTETNLSEPGDLIAALLNVAALLGAGMGRKPVLLVDEAEAFGNLTNADAIEEFAFALRRIVQNDNTVLGFIATVHADGGMDAAPGILTRDEIMTRVDYQQGYIDLADLVLDARDARDFVVGVLGHLVDQDAARVEIEAKGLEVEPEYFPFTEEGVDSVAEFVTEDPERASPRQILAILSGALGLQWNRRRDAESPLVDAETLRDVMYPDERA